MGMNDAPVLIKPDAFMRNLLEGSSLKEVAYGSGIHEKTLYFWCSGQPSQCGREPYNPAYAFDRIIDQLPEERSLLVSERYRTKYELRRLPLRASVSQTGVLLAVARTQEEVAEGLAAVQKRIAVLLDRQLRHEITPEEAMDEMNQAIEHLTNLRSLWQQFEMVAQDSNVRH